MRSSLKGFLRDRVNDLLFQFDIELVRASKNFKNYIPFKATIKEARELGLSVGEYIDLKHNVPGATQQTIDQMMRLGVFSIKVNRVCEIGPGSGRYLEKVKQICAPNYYEIYETAKDWKMWLTQKYGVIAHAASAFSLDKTPSASIDLVQAHKVFPGLDVITICRYFGEMVRVTRPYGKIVFDILTEECLEDSLLDDWFASGAQYACSMIAKQFAVNFFCRRGCVFDGSFFIPMLPGITQYFIFTRCPETPGVTHLR